MARELQQTAPDDRRRRVQRLKKMIIGIVIVGLLIPILCCVYLICRLHAINGTLRDLEQRLEELDARDRERQTLLQQLQSETAIQQGVQTQEEVTSGEVSEHTPESDPGQEMIHKVYLTFDDGPSIYTDEILDILDRYHVKATFFVVGKDGSEAEAALQRIVEDGHTLGMHSYSHKYKELYESLDSFTEDFARIRDDIYQATGVESVYYRFPGGSSNTVSNIDMHEFIDYLDSQGVLPVLTLNGNAERMVQEGIRQTDNGATFLSLNPAAAQRLVQNINSAVENAVNTDGQPVILASPIVRPHLAQLITRFLPTVPVISQAEIPSDIRLQAVGTVSAE